MKYEDARELDLLNIRKMSWKDFLVEIKKAANNDGFIELEMYKNFLLRFKNYNRKTKVITVEQQYMYNLRKRKTINKDEFSTSWPTWWNTIKPEITKVYFRKY